jgi:formamidopyrimidine-DNA glycosylase
MPELPEVETVARQLAPQARRLELIDPMLRHGAAPRVAGRPIEDVARAGKRVVLRLGPRDRSGRPLWIAVHLRMTGRLLWIADGEPWTRERLRARLAVDGGALLFHDTRRLGTLTWSDAPGTAEPAGLDPMSTRFTADAVRTLVAGSRQNVKAWLLRQDRLTGIGNIYASEILHAARISPRRKAGSLRTAEIVRLADATRRILGRAIQLSGTTFSDFQDTTGSIGSYQRFLAVYEREGRPCRRCGGPVLRLVQQQRSTYWCRGCQR